MITITNNADLQSFAESLFNKPEHFGIRVKDEVRVYNNKRAYNKALKATPDAVNGTLTAYNWSWYRF